MTGSLDPREPEGQCRFEHTTLPYTGSWGFSSGGEQCHAPLVLLPPRMRNSVFHRKQRLQRRFARQLPTTLLFAGANTFLKVQHLTTPQLLVSGARPVRKYRNKRDATTPYR